MGRAVKSYGKVWVALGVVLVYLSTFHPSDWVRITAQTITGPHPYVGVWILIPHLLFYCTFTALLAGACWIALARAGAMQPPPLKISKSVLLWGLAGGAISVLASLVFLYAAGMGQLNWVGFDGWKIAGRWDPSLALVMGGGLAGATVHGNWQGLAPEVTDQGDVPGSNDYRNVLGDVVSGRLGLSAADLSTVFPGHRHQSLGIMRV
jgi:hypothetical protein